MKIKLYFLCFFISIISIANGQTTLQTGLVAYYTFNGDANDQSGNLNNGVVYGATLAADRFGTANRAYAFNGSSNYIMVPNSTTLNLNTSTMTISYWMYWSNNDPNYIGISKGGVNQYAGYELNLRGSYNGDNGYFSFSQANSSLNLAGANAYRNSWVHLVGTFDNGTARLYINGALVSATNLSYSYTSQCTNNLYIGTRDPGNQWIGFLNGYMDDIRIYNRTLSSTEVSNLYNIEKVAPTTTSLSTINQTAKAVFTQIGNKVCLSSKSHCQVYNLQGVEVLNLEAEEFDINKSGAYILRITDSSGVVSVDKIIVR